MTDLVGYEVGAALVGMVGGLALFARGLVAYRIGSQVASISSSPVSSLAAGEVRVSGTARPAAVTLVSPLRSRPCLYYRATISEERGRDTVTVFHRERGVGFLLDDGTGTIRVFPGGARWDLPEDFHERDGIMGDSPIGLQVNDGPDAAVASGLDRETAIAQLLTVHQPARTDGLPDGSTAGSLGTIAGGLGAGALGFATGRREYHEAILEPGSIVTVVGTARPFSDLPDPLASDVTDGSVAALDDPEIAADLGAARAAGALAGDPKSAWGNAAIPGFGIGQPTQSPALDPAAAPEPVVPETAAAAEKAARDRFDIPADALVIALDAEAPLAIFLGTPGQAEGRAQDRFLLGIGGALLAIVSAVALALVVSGTIG